MSLTPLYLRKVAALANVFRPYGLRVYLSARFSAPIEIGGLKTADPLNPGVRAWWRGKADQIYRIIPDFGGFLVKANSEGQPGPLTAQPGLFLAGSWTNTGWPATLESAVLSGHTAAAHALRRLTSATPQAEVAR